MSGSAFHSFDPPASTTRVRAVLESKPLSARPGARVQVPTGRDAALPGPFFHFSTLFFLPWRGAGITGGRIMAPKLRARFFDFRRRRGFRNARAAADGTKATRAITFQCSFGEGAR